MDDSKLRTAPDREVKQTQRRAKLMGEAMAGALLNRVEPNTDVIRVTHNEYMRMREDPEFVSFATYVNNLVYYSDGRVRPKPVRPLLKNEMGTYRGKIVVMSVDSPEGGGGIIAQVTSNIGEKA